ncbi:MAG: hypothetical protein H7X93_02875 [Sphingomonadaceae bacterium]|nr:hypothetical protein [Sphingomonadaceae bacterium]
MLKIDDVQQIGSITAYGDDRKPNLFYLLPGGPRFRTDENGRPIFRFIKYRELREEGGDFFGGLVTFDTCLSVPETQLTEVKAALQARVNAHYQRMNVSPPPVEIGPPTYTTGTVSLTIEGANSQLVQKVNSAGVPSLYGENVATFWVELTKEGATIFEAAMRGQGGFVGANYKVKVWAKLPPITGSGFWNATKFYSFAQTIDTEDNFWSEDSYTEDIQELLIQNEVQTIHLDPISIPGMPAADQQALANELRSNLYSQLEAMVERNMLKEIQKTDPDTKSLREEQDIEDVKRTVTNNQIASVTLNLSEAHTIEWALNPQGTLPNITTMTGPDGPIKWEDYAMEVDLNDPFFQTLEVSLMVNADFKDLPLHSVEAKLSYPLGDQKVQEFVFKAPEDVGRFRTFIVNKHKKYKYSYTVNYAGESRTFTSPEVETDDTRLTINVDELGIWVVDISAGDINFAQVKQAQITVRTEEADTPIERQFTMNEQVHDFKIREVTMRPRKQPFKYRVKYFMTDGKEFDSGWQEQDAPQLYINDPFAATQTVSLRAIGDLTNKIASIMVDLTYADEANAYVQKKTISLSQAQAFFDWSFPVITETGGKVGYSATILYKDGTSTEIPETQATRSTIQLGDVVADRLEVAIIPDLLDFTVVKLVNASLHYEDAANGISERKDFIFKTGDAAKTWTVDLKDKMKTGYSWSAKYFLTDGTQRATPPTPTQELSLLLELPAA